MMFLYARRHECIDRGKEQVNGRFLTTAHAGAITTDHRHVIALLQQKRRHDANAFIQAGYLDVLIIGFRQVFPKLPVRFKCFLQIFRLAHALQGAICANSNTNITTLTGFRINGDRKQAA